MGEVRKDRLRRRARIAVIVVLLARTAPAAGPLDEGNDLLRKGDYKSASQAFASVLKSDPGNREALMGLARSLSFSGDYAGGEKAYRAVLAAAPGDVEARIGLSDVLAWQNRYEESEDVLARLSAERPDDPEIRSRRDKVALWAGQRAAARMKREAEAGLSTLRISRANPGTQAWAALRDRSRAGWELLARADYLHRFGEDEGRGTIGATRKWDGGRNLRFEGGASPGADIFSRYAAEAELGWPLLPGLAGYLGGKFARFSTADVWNLAAALEYYPLPRDALLFRFVRSYAKFDGAGSDGNNTWLAKLTHFFTDDDRAWIYYSRGSESYQAGTADQIGNVFADIYGAGGRYFPTSSWGIEGNVDVQRRGDGNNYLTLTAIVYRRF